MDILKRMHAARSAAVTCSASRHAAEIGETMARYECYPLTDDPGEAQEAGESIAATVAALWEARAEVERLRTDLETAERALDAQTDFRAEIARLRSNLAVIEDEKNAYIEYVGDALGQDHDGETLWDAAQRVLSERDCLRADAARLDWLADPGNQIGNVHLPTECVLAHPESMRAAIDAAMRME